MASTTRVILFDIDGTLVLKQSTDTDELERFRRAIVDEVGRSPPTQPWRYDGMVDPQICRLLLIDVGLSEGAADKHLRRVIERVGEIYKAMEKHPILNDGVGELLKILRVSSKHELGVVTGNLSVVAEEKLGLTGTRAYFDETFYSDGYFERRDLVREAVHACVMKYQLRGKDSVVIIGDTPRDIDAAKCNGAKAIAVATGHFSEGQLASAGADAVFRDLNPRTDLLKALDFEIA
jgi:phosphoglycolate phosphatase-like HAD superfamily hydrolase